MARRNVENFVVWRHPFQWTWADSAAKSAQSVDAGDLWKFGLQIDTGAVYFLTDDSPVTWTELAGSGGGGSGTVTSVAMTVPSILSVSGSPITTSGTLALSLATQTANRVWAGPTTGSAAAPTFRALVLADLPTGVLLTANNLSYIASASTARTNLELGGAAILNVGTGSGDVAAGIAPAAAISAHLIASDPHGDRAYTDAQIAAMLTSAFDFKASVLVATTANITLSGTQTIDGVSVTAGTRVLVKDQSTGSQNGIWVCASGSWTRSTDADVDAEVTAGFSVPVEQGTINGGRLFMLTTSGTITVGTTALTFTRIDAGDLAAANNLSDLTSASSARTNLGLAAIAASGSASDLSTGTLPIARIADGAVTLAKLANIATARILGRTTAGSGVPEELTAAQAQSVMALDVDTTELGAIARSRVRKNSTGTVYKRRQLNLIEGSGITLTLADDSVNEETDITIAASGGSGGASIITTPVNAAVGASTDQYCQVGGTQTIALANEARNRWYCPRAGTIQKMYVWINAAASTQPASGSYEITIYKNNATAGPTITIAAGATVSTVQSDTSTTLSVAAGDYLHVRLKNNATGTACNVACITFEIAF